MKIAFIGLDQALTKPETGLGEKIERAVARLGEIPRLIDEAVQNLVNIPETYYHAARAMLTDCKLYLKETGKGFHAQPSDRLLKGLQRVRSALDKFEKFEIWISKILIFSEFSNCSRPPLEKLENLKSWRSGFPKFPIFPEEDDDEEEEEEEATSSFVLRPFN